MRVGSPPSPTLPYARAGGADLHMHTTASDGLLSGRQLVDRMCRHRVAVGAITNHDDASVGRDVDLARYVASLGPDAPRVVPGVEITCGLEAPLEPGGSAHLHIVGVGCNPRDLALRKALLRQRRGVSDRVRDCVKKLQTDGYDVSVGELGLVAGRRCVYGGDIARLLVKKGYAKTKAEADVKLVAPRLSKPGELPVPDAMPAKEAIALIRAAGGVAVLAHPHRAIPSHDPQRVLSLMRSLRSHGLDAAEVYRADLEPERQPMYAACARSAGLLISGGSDFHSASQRGTGRHPGDARAPESVWRPIEALIRQRGGCTDICSVPRTPIRWWQAAALRNAG